MIRRWIVAVVVLNWFVWGTLTWMQGGEALTGDITRSGEHLIRRQPDSPGVTVSEGYWIFSLVHSSLTLIATPLLLGVAFTFGRPKWDRGIVDAIVWVACILWASLATLMAAEQFVRWLGSRAAS